MITQLNSFGVTDIGCHRSRNEDQYLMSGLHQPIVADVTNSTACNSLVTDRTILLAVADGVGGNRGGAIASELAVDSLGSFAQQHETSIRYSKAAWKLANLLRQGILSADRTIDALASGHSTKYNMATTLTAALIQYPYLVIGHVGDSRCYLLRDNRLERLTRDHTLAELYHTHSPDQDSSNPESLKTTPMSHVLWNCLGGHNGDIDVESHVVELKPDDWILLCTDGLGRHVSDAEIEESATFCKTPKELCVFLKELVIERGGKDNVTILACNWQSTGFANSPVVASVSKTLNTTNVSD